MGCPSLSQRNRTFECQYDHAGRRAAKRVNGGAWRDPEGSGKYWVCEYDLRGNRTKWRHTFYTDSWYSYGWDAQDRLTKVYSNSNAKTTEYKYDHAGRRAAKKVDSGAWRWYSYDGLKVVAEGTSSTSKMYYTTAPSDPGGIICRDASAGTNPLYYHYDRLGNVMAVTDSNGALCAPYTMDAFGNVLQCGTSTGYSATQSDPQPYHLTTKEWDPDSALFYFNARWYERGIGMFVARGWVRVENEHPYIYCSNAPTYFVDPEGLKEDLPKISRDPGVDPVSCKCDKEDIEKQFDAICDRAARCSSLIGEYENARDIGAGDPGGSGKPIAVTLCLPPLTPGGKPLAEIRWKDPFPKETSCLNFCALVHEITHVKQCRNMKSFREYQNQVKNRPWEVEIPAYRTERGCLDMLAKKIGKSCP